MRACGDPRDAAKIEYTYRELRRITRVTEKNLLLLGQHGIFNKLLSSLVESLSALYDEAKTNINMIANIILQLRSAHAPPMFSEALISTVLPAESSAFLRQVRS